MHYKSECKAELLNVEVLKYCHAAGNVSILQDAVCKNKFLHSSYLLYLQDIMRFERFSVSDCVSDAFK